MPRSLRNQKHEITSNQQARHLPKRELTFAEWETEAVKRFGTDRMNWKFVCPMCGHVASVADWKAVGATSGEAGYSCVGRHIKGKIRKAFGGDGPGPCDYAGGGLFRMNPVYITDKHISVFELAEGEGNDD